ncbi:MAG: TRAM domain-containing protein [archaeon GB-1867-005]|nr:TRAM domain-containing protein [Candidatus Culexmicrobium cathedralense]
MAQKRPRKGGRRRIKPAYLLPKPVSVGDEIAVEIEGLSRRGEGVARVQGYVIFVPDVKPGEKVTIKITSVKPSFATGEVIGR